MVMDVASHRYGEILALVQRVLDPSITVTVMEEFWDCPTDNHRRRITVIVSLLKQSEMEVKAVTLSTKQVLLPPVIQRRTCETSPRRTTPSGF